MDTVQFRTAEIEFLYLDMSSCSRCVASDASVRQAMALLRPVLAVTGVRLELRTVHVTTAAQAAAHQLVSSPTIRVGGTDIAAVLAETSCGDCTTLSTGDTPIACRIWQYRGRQYTDAPVGLIVDAVLKHLYGHLDAAPAAPGYDGLPRNLERFFGGS